MVAIAHSFSDDSEQYYDEAYITKNMAIRARLPKLKEPLEYTTDTRINVLKQELINQAEHINTIKNPLSEKMYPGAKKPASKEKKQTLPWQNIANNPDHPVNTRRRLAFFQTFVEFAN